MTAPRQFLSACLYLVTRRTERRHHLFRPDAVMNQIFLYCVGVAAAQSGVMLILAVLLSNHYHIGIADVRGRAPLFTQILNQLMTKCVQAHRGWVGRVFDGEGPSYVEPLNDTACVRELAYALANPTTSGLLRFASEWPGVRTRIEDLGTLVVIVERPRIFFCGGGIMPDRVELRFELPEDLVARYGGVERLRAAIAAEHDRQESEARKELERAGRRFMSRRRVLEISPYARAKTYEPRHRLNPHFAGDRAAIEAAVARRREFLADYAACRTAWCADRRDLEWPIGTYVMRYVHHVRVAAPPA